MILGSRRGVLVRVLRRRQLNRAIDREHLLRGIYELLETQRDPAFTDDYHIPVSHSDLLAMRSWSPAQLGWRIRQAEREGLIQEIRTALETGIDGTDVRSGLIGEIGASTPLHANEEKCLRAAAQAQKESGAPFSIHPGHEPGAPKALVDLVTEEGADPNRLIMSHVDNRFRDNLDLYKELADTGCHLSFDCFGRQMYFASFGRQHPSDDVRINAVAGLIADGYIDQIMVAHDCCFRIDLTTWGGYGYGYVLDHMVPRLEAAGVGVRELQKMMIENPKRFLAFG